MHQCSEHFFSKYINERTLLRMVGEAVASAHEKEKKNAWILWRGPRRKDSGY